MHRAISAKFNTLSEIRQELGKGAITCESLVQHYCDRYEATRHLNAYLEHYGDEALARAKEIDKKLHAGTAGKLAGLVVSIKDNIVYKDHHSSASSKILNGFKSLYSSTVVERLLAEDAIIIGRTNCDEFAMGASNENSAYGIVKNAFGDDLVPGGSSGGAAVSVQTDTCLAALGSDTGGSVRQPAAFTGLYGMKPSYGLVSRWGLIAYASSLDQISPITRSVNDMAEILSVICGPDEHDATLRQAETPQFKIEGEGRPLRIATLGDATESEGLHPEIRKYFEGYIGHLRKQGHVVEKVNLSCFDAMVPCYYVITTAEASSNLSRFQGLQYGYRSPNAHDLESTFKLSRSEGFGPEVKRRIMLGTFVLSSGYYDAYYTKAQKVRRLIRNETEQIFQNFDVILLPTTPTPAFRFGEKAKDPIAMYLADIFTVQSPLAGGPALSFPAKALAEGLPFGVQLMGPRFADNLLLNHAAQLQAEADPSKW